LIGACTAITIIITMMEKMYGIIPALEKIIRTFRTWMD